MRSPIADGWVTSEYGRRGGGTHAGIDIRARGGYGTEVQATFAGVVEKVVSGRRHGDTSRRNELAPYRTGNGLIIRNPDGEAQLYGHVAPSVRVGQRIAEGQVIGKVDNSGNTSGPHVHYEEWTRYGTTRNPRVSFKAFGVTPGKGKATPTPYPAGRLPANPTWDELFAALDKVVRGAGQGGGRRTRAERLQKWLLDAGHLRQANGRPGVVDGVWGEQSWKALQRRLADRSLRKPYRGPIDGKAPRSGRVGTTWNCAAAFCNDRRATARRAK